MINEKWRPVPNFENIYEVSNLGKVRRSLKETPHDGTFPGRILKPETINGYKRVVLCVKNKTQKALVHRLVAFAFIKNPRKLLTINHKDGNKANNCVENLEWCTQLENRRHAMKLGLWDLNGANCHLAKLTNIEVLEIRRLYAEGKSIKELKDIFKASHQSVYLAAIRKTWKHI